jgi:H/ACA ribonucleoprotein complex non-core subunit NAF1
MEPEILDVPESARSVNLSATADQKKDEHHLAQHQPTEPIKVNTNSNNNILAHDAMEEDSDLPLTHALEALLGGLDVPVAELKAVSSKTELPLESPSLPEPTIHSTPQQNSTIVPEKTPITRSENEVQGSSNSENAHKLDIIVAQNPTHPVVSMNSAQEFPAVHDVPMKIDPSTSEIQKDDGSRKEVQSEMDKAAGESTESTAQSTHNGHETMDIDFISSNIQGIKGSTTDTPSAPDKFEDQPFIDSTAQAPQIDGEAVDTPMAEEGEHPEWEVDSSPIESSSDDSSSDDSSSDESDEGDAAYKLLTPEEQARLLMEGDGSDDEDGGKAKGAAAQLRTKNELPETVVPKPDVTITEEMPIEQLGTVDQIVDNIVLIKAKTSGEYRVLESGSVLCLADRSVVGIVSETIGRVQQPFYSILFTNATAASEAGLSMGTVVFYSIQHSTYVFTQALKAIKGSDASNLHDEEVGDEEMEFSDDEAEAEHKRRVKQKRMEKRGGKQQNSNSNRGGHPLKQQHNATSGLNYDEDEEGPYKTLARPVGYENSVGRSEAPQESEFAGQDRPRDQNREFRGRERGDRGRGRGDRGRGRGDRGRGRGGYENRPQSRDGYSLPPRPPQSYGPSPYGPLTTPVYPQFGGVPPVASPQMQQAPFAYPSPQQYNPQQPHVWPQFPPPPPQGFPQPPYQQMPNIPGWPNTPPGGAFINPAFFNGNQASSAKPNQWNGQGQWGKKPDGT